MRCRAWRARKQQSRVTLEAVSRYTSLTRHATFTDVIFLLHHDRLPSPGERRLMDAILVGVADHGAGAPSCAAARLAASGNRQSPAAAIAAGVLTIGDEHGGAGSGCME